MQIVTRLLQQPKVGKPQLFISGDISTCSYGSPPLLETCTAHAYVVDASPALNFSHNFKQLVPGVSCVVGDADLSVEERSAMIRESCCVIVFLSAKLVQQKNVEEDLLQAKTKATIVLHDLPENRTVEDGSFESILDNCPSSVSALGLFTELALPYYHESESNKPSLMLIWKRLSEICANSPSSHQNPSRGLSFRDADQQVSFHGVEMALARQHNKENLIYEDAPI